MGSETNRFYKPINGTAKNWSAFTPALFETAWNKERERPIGRKGET